MHKFVLNQMKPIKTLVSPNVMVRTCYMQELVQKISNVQLKLSKRDQFADKTEKCTETNVKHLEMK